MIGLHSVTFAADPHLDNVWAPPFNVNPELATGMSSWSGVVGSWSWAGGQALGTTVTSQTWLGLVSSPNVPKPPTTALLRVTAGYTLNNANTYRVTLQLGYSSTTSGWQTLHETVVMSPGQGTHTVELISDPALVTASYNYLAMQIKFEANSGAPSAQWPQSVAVDYVRLQSATAADLATDLSCLVDEVSIHHGRDDSDSQPEASSCTLDISTDQPGGLPTMVDVGGVITVTTTLPTGQSVRFKGRVTDISQGWDDAGPATPDRPVAQVIATGSLADLGRRVVGDAPWPQQLDGARVAAILAAAGVTVSPATSDPGTVQILPRDVDSQPALDLAQAVASDAGGLVWALRAGEIRYADANHRRNTVAAMTLDACDVLVTPTWRRTTEGLINDVSIGYGVAPEGDDGGEQPRYLADRPASKATFGTYGVSVSTQLAALEDAQAMGDLLLVRISAPVWLLGALPLDVANLSEADTAALLGLEMHSLLTVTGMPAAGSVPTSALLWVEGWRETLAWGVHSLELVVSGYCRTSPPPRWDDVNPATTWDSVGAITWDDAACMGPQPNLGRWDDQPANLRWDQIAPAKTWDTYA